MLGDLKTAQSELSEESLEKEAKELEHEVHGSGTALIYIRGSEVGDWWQGTVAKYRGRVS